MHRTTEKLLKLLRELAEDDVLFDIYNIDPGCKAPLDVAVCNWVAEGYPDAAVTGPAHREEPCAVCGLPSSQHIPGPNGRRDRINNCEMEFSGTSVDCQMCVGGCPGRHEWRAS